MPEWQFHGLKTSPFTLKDTFLKEVRHNRGKEECILDMRRFKLGQLDLSMHSWKTSFKSLEKLAGVRQSLAPCLHWLRHRPPNQTTFQPAALSPCHSANKYLCVATAPTVSEREGRREGGDLKYASNHLELKKNVKMYLKKTVKSTLILLG